MPSNRWFYTIPLRLRTLFRRNRVEQELDAELRDHLDHRIDENTARGMTLDQARLEAIREMNGIEKTKDEIRDARRVHLIEDAMNDSRLALRMLRKNMGFAAVAILTLALGIGANTAIFSVVQNVLLRPLPFDHPESLVEIWNTYLPAVPRAGLSPGDFQDWQRAARSFSQMAGYGEIPQGFNLTGDGDPQRIQITYASSNLFPLLGVRPVTGRLFSPEEDKAGSGAVALLSHHLWLSRFGGDPAVVGRSITLDGQRYSVIGVLPPSSTLFRPIDVWLPLGKYPDDLTSHVHHGITAIARLKSGVTVAQARAEIQDLNHQALLTLPDTHKNVGVEVQPLEDPSAAGLRRTLLVLFAAVGLVLLIACANIANLLLARNSAREKEFALRTALGASSRRLAQQLLTESVLLSLLGGALGLLFAAGAIRVIGALAPAGQIVVQETSVNGTVLAFTIAVCFAAGVACGLLPAIQARTKNLNAVLKQGGKGTGAFGGHKLQNILVISEIALALVPLAGAGLLLRSLNQLLSVSPGFRTEHILTMQISQASISFEQFQKLSQDQQAELGKKQSLQFEQIAARIEALPGVQAAGGISTLPLGSVLKQASRFLIEGQPIPDAGVRPIAQTRGVSLGYFSAAGIPLLKGRGFDQRDWILQNIIINDFMARRFWPAEDPLGKRINLCSLAPQPCWFQVVGVVGNVHQFGLEAAPTYDVYFSNGWTPNLIVRTASDPLALVPAVTAAVHEIDPNLPVTDVMTMDTLLSDSVSPRRFSAVLIGVFAALALLLAAVGIFGVMSYTVGRRTPEIGIRMALGAQPGNVLKLILGRGARLALIGVVAGLAGALALTRFLSSLLFGIQPRDPVTFAGVAALLILVALAACYVPARRAMRVDPVVALRYE